MSIVQTAVTTTALIWAIGTYVLQMYGAYTAQQANISDASKGLEVDAGYVVGGTIMNIVLTLYLLYYIYAIRYDKHGDMFKIAATFLLIAGIALDIFLAVYAVQVTPATTKGQVWQSYDWTYIVSSLNFLVRLFLIVQFQCSDVLARRFKSAPAPAAVPTVVEQVKKQFLPGNTGPRPDRGPNPFVKSEEGGKRRSR